jgi:hypothetical protein
VIRNHWGKADPVTVTLEAWAEGSFQVDPYVTIVILHAILHHQFAAKAHRDFAAKVHHSGLPW